MTTPSALTYAEIVEHCSRLHTTRTRPLLPWEPDGEQREDSHMLDIYLDGRPAVVVPTRMHEPGFYVRSPNDAEVWTIRSASDLLDFYEAVEAGKVTRREQSTVPDHLPDNDESRGHGSVR